jgi:hypothetical protein
VCHAMILNSPDKDHSAARYGQMLKLLSLKLSSLSDASVRCSAFASLQVQKCPVFGNTRTF